MKTIQLTKFKLFNLQDAAKTDQGGEFTAINAYSKDLTSVT